MLQTTSANQLPHALRNADYPNTYIAKVCVSLDDPDHWVTLEWDGPQAEDGETGPFRSSPGAGIQGRDCDDEVESQRDGSKCTPKGSFFVQGFEPHLNDDPRAVHVTWFKQERSIGLHFYPEVPAYAASHGCVRLQEDHAAQLIYDNSVVGETEVIVEGTWTKPPHQWPF